MSDVNNKNARKAQILFAAEQCFREKGFHQSSMHDICAQAGLSPGTVYHYFKNKEAIIEEMAQEERNRVVAMFNSCDKDLCAVDKLIFLAETYLIQALDPYYVSLSWEIMSESTRNPNVKNIVKQCDLMVMNDIKEILNQGIQKGEIKKDIDINLTALILASLADGFFYRCAVNDKTDYQGIINIMKDWVKSNLLP